MFDDLQTTEPLPELPPVEAPRLAPHSQELEEAVLGAILIYADALLEVSFLTADHFYFRKHALIWEAMNAVYKRGEALDNLTLGEELRNRKERDGQSRLDLIGGQAYLTRLANNCPTYLGIETYGAWIERLSVRRRLLESAQKIAQYAIEEQIDSSQAVSLSIKEILGVETRKRQGRRLTLGQAMQEDYSVMEERLSSKTLPYLPLGYSALDQITGGAQPGYITFVCGWPGRGKSAALMSMALNISQTWKVPTIFHSLEMSQEELRERVRARLSRIKMDDIRNINYRDDDSWRRVVHGTEIAQDIDMTIDDTRMTISELESSLRRTVNEIGNRIVVFLDYIQLIQPDPPPPATDKWSRYQPHKKDYEHESDIVARLDEVAHELRIPIVAASQLKRETEESEDSPPSLNMLAGTRRYEQIAQSIICIGRNNPNKSLTANVAGPVKWWAIKTRFGPGGYIELDWRPQTQEYNPPPTGVPAHVFTAREKEVVEAGSLPPWMMEDDL